MSAFPRLRFVLVAGAVLLLVAGIAMPKQVVVWQDDAVAVRVAPAPIAGGGGLSVNVTGY